MSPGLAGPPFPCSPTWMLQGHCSGFNSTHYPQFRIQSEPWESVGTRIFADVIPGKDRDEVLLCQGGLKSNDREETDARKKAMLTFLGQLYHKPRSTRSHQRLEEARKDLPGASCRADCCWGLDFAFYLELEENTFLLFWATQFVAIWYNRKCDTRKQTEDPAQHRTLCV